MAKLIWSQSLGWLHRGVGEPRVEAREAGLARLAVSTNGPPSTNYNVKDSHPWRTATICTPLHGPMWDDRTGDGGGRISPSRACQWVTHGIEANPTTPTTFSSARRHRGCRQESSTSGLTFGLILSFCAGLARPDRHRARLFLPPVALPRNSPSPGETWI